MLRWTVSLAVLVAMLAATTELEAQRRAPIRNMIRSIGHGWGTGNHWQNPGYDTGYYSPEQNWQIQGANGIIPDGQIIQPPVNGQSPSIQPQIQDNSASRLLNQQPYSPNYQINRGIQITPYQTIQNPQIRQPGTTGTINDQTRINQSLKPYHSERSKSAIPINNGGGEFQITPSRIPAGNTHWNSQYNQQFKNSQPFTPRK